MEDRPQKQNNERRFIDWLIAIFCIALAILLFFFVRQYQTLRRESIISARESFIANAIKNHPRLTAGDTGIIRSWMTFDYVNKLFGLPPEYLKGYFAISNSGYPKLTIGKFASGARLNASSTLAGVQNAVSQYLANQSTTPISSASST